MDVIPHLDGDPATPAFSKWPVGLGFFADVESSKPILTKGQPITDRAFIIPLKVDPNVGANGISWNMIGDPFPFDVPFNSVLVDTPTGRISLQEAATRGYILPNIYTYSGGTGYTFATLPAGALQAWTGHWVGITSAVNLNLVVPPAKASRAAVVPSRAAAPGGWSLQIGAHTKDLHDTFNFIGMSSSAKDGYDLTDAPKPPMTGPYVSIGTQHSDWAGKSGVYASDMRSVGSNKTWTVVANTDQANADVTVSWNTAVLHKNVRLIIKDDASGQTYDMRSRAALTYNSGSTPAPRTFTITAGQSLGRALRITNLNVRPNGRGSGTSVIGFSLMGDATYEVTVLSSAGHTVTNVATRAAAGSGDVSLIWNGRDNSGKSVAAGTYLVQVRATTTDGESVRAIQPFTVVR
jgi:flagellar hook assembly protein FlgD